MKTKLLTICLLFLTMQAYADDQLDSDGLVVANENFGDNICEKPSSNLKKNELVLCDVFAGAIFQTRDRKIGLPKDEYYGYYESSIIIGFTYENKTNKLFIIAEEYYYASILIDGERHKIKKRKGAVTIPLQNLYYPDRVHFAHFLSVFPTESELSNTQSLDIKSYRELFPNVCNTSSSEYDKYICEWE